VFWCKAPAWPRSFFIPNPYDSVSGHYFLEDAGGNAYKTAQFDKPDLSARVWIILVPFSDLPQTQNRSCDAPISSPLTLKRAGSARTGSIMALTDLRVWRSGRRWQYQA